MMSIPLILNCLIILTYQCSTLMDNKLFITSTQNEMIKIPLSQLFMSNDYDQITFEPAVEQFTITNPLQEIEKAPNHRNGQIISIKMVKSTTSSEPLHLMAILSLKEGIYYSEYDLKYYSTFPNLEVVYPSTEKDNSKCYDIALMNTIIITECSDNEGDYFSILKINQSTHTYISIQKPKDAFRKLDMIDQYLLRGTVDKLELYQEKEQTLELLNILDQATLRIILNQQSIVLQIRDFQTHTNGWVSILNASGEIIILQYINNQWKWINTIDTKILNVYSYDFDVYKNTYVILSEQQLYYKAITSQTFTTDVDSKPVDKVFLQKGSILLVQDKILTLYSQSLYKSYLQTLENSQYLINSFPSYEGILIIDDKYFSKYIINSEYQLQFSANSLPIEKDYKMIKIHQQTKQCVVEIYFIVVSFESTQIYTSQVPQALITLGIFQDKLDVQLNPIFQGYNLQYEFKEHDILNLKVQQYQGIEIINIGDTQDIIYRKSLSNLNNPYIQIIQQNSNKQISGYTCESLLNQLQLNCQSIFAKTQFEQLQDSDKQLWWFNYDSIFLAILKDSTITIYCVFYKQNKFDKLTTINLGDNIQKITTDGNYLFVQLQNFVQIYTVSVSNKAILLHNKKIDGDIYASPGQQNLLFIDFIGQLMIYSIEQDKFSLIWFTERNDIYDQKNLVIFRNRFARLIKKKDVQEYIAIVFNIQNLNNIYFEKQILLNNNSPLKLTQIEVNLQQSLFFIVVQNNEKYNLQVYKIDDVSYNSKFISLEYTSTAQFSITSQYCFITDSIGNKQVQKNYYITGNNFVKSTLKEGFHQVQFSQEISLTVQINSGLQSTITQIVPALIVNRGVSIFQTKNFLNLTYKADGTQNHCINLDQSWYSGQVFDIIQKQQSEKLKFIKTLSKEIETLEFSPFIQEFNSDTLVQLMENKIILVQKSDLTKKEFNLDNTYKIKKLLIIYNQLIYVEVLKGDLNYIKIIECTDLDCKLLEDEIAIQIYINKVYLHNNNFFIYSYPDIFVYDTKGDPKKISAFEQFYNFTLFTETFYLEFQHLQDDVYSVISVDFRGNSYFYNLEVSRTSTDYQMFAPNVINILQLNKLYVNIHSVCMGINIRKNQIILAYNNIPTFQFKFEFDCTINKLCELKYFELNGVYQQFGEWIMFNIYPIIYSNENILSLIYWSQTHFEILLFDLQTVSSNENPNVAIAHLITPTSKIPGEFYQIQSFVYMQNGQLHLLASSDDYNKLSHYTLKRSAQICTTAQQVNDIINLTLSNSISNINVNLNITIQEDNQIPPSPPSPPKPPNDDDIDDDQQNFPKWAIILIVLGVLIIGISIFICWKKSSKKVEDDKQLLV